MRRLLSCAAFVACAVSGVTMSAQVPETLYHSDSTEYNVPLWRAFIDAVNSQDEQALGTQSDLEILTKEYEGECFSSRYDRHGDESVIDGLDVRSSLESASKRADYAAEGEVVSVVSGVYRGLKFGSIIELRIRENLGRIPFPEGGEVSRKRPVAARTIYYFYPVWEFEFMGVLLCGGDPAVPALLPEPGDRMIVFAREDDVGDAPWYFGSASVFPVLGESERSGRLWSTPWTPVSSTRNVPEESPVSLAAAAAQLRRALNEGGVE